MPSFEVTDPTGKKHLVNAPEGATQQDAIEFIDFQLNNPTPQQPTEPQPRQLADGEGSDFTRGIGTYYDQMGGIFGGTKVLAGKAFGSEDLIESGLESMEESDAAIGRRGTKETDSFTKAIDKGAISFLTEYIPFVAGQGVGMISEAVVTSIAGGLLGSAVGPGGTVAGGLGGFVGKNLVKKKIKQEAERIAREEGKDASELYLETAAKEEFKDLMKDPLLRSQVNKQIGKTTALIGMAGKFGTGEVTGRAVDEAIKDITDPQEQLEAIQELSTGRLAGLSTAHALADYIGIKIGLGALEKLAEPTRNMLFNIAKKIGTTGGQEAVVEAVQTGIERFGAYLPLADKEAMEEYINAAAAGFFMPIVPSAISGITSPTTKTPTEIDPEVDPKGDPEVKKTNFKLKGKKTKKEEEAEKKEMEEAAEKVKDITETDDLDIQDIKKKKTKKQIAVDKKFKAQAVKEKNKVAKKKIKAEKVVTEKIKKVKEAKTVEAKTKAEDNVVEAVENLEKVNVEVKEVEAKWNSIDIIKDKEGKPILTSQIGQERKYDIGETQPIGEGLEITEGQQEELSGKEEELKQLKEYKDNINARIQNKENAEEITEEQKLDIEEDKKVLKTIEAEIKNYDKNQKKIGVQQLIERVQRPLQSSLEGFETGEERSRLATERNEYGSEADVTEAQRIVNQVIDNKGIETVVVDEIGTDAQAQKEIRNKQIEGGFTESHIIEKVLRSNPTEVDGELVSETAVYYLRPRTKIKNLDSKKGVTVNVNAIAKHLIEESDLNLMDSRAIKKKDRSTNPAMVKKWLKNNVTTEQFKEIESLTKDIFSRINNKFKSTSAGTEAQKNETQMGSAFADALIETAQEDTTSPKKKNKKDKKPLPVSTQSREFIEESKTEKTIGNLLKDFNKKLKNISKAIVNPMQEALLEAFENIESLGNTKFSVVKSIPGQARATGSYDTKENRIRITQDATIEDIFHEITHAATANEVRRQVDAEGKGITTAGKRLVSIFNAAKKAAVDEGTTYTEALSNIDEFITYALTNKEFQNFLANTPTTLTPQKGTKKDKSLWSSFVDSVKNLLGLGDISNTLLNDILVVTPAFLKGIDTSAFKKRKENLENWAGKSLATRNKDGELIVFYHATRYDFNTFKPGKGNAIYVSPSAEEAQGIAYQYKVEDSYNRSATPKEGSQVLPVYVRVDNIFDFDNVKDVDTVYSAILKQKGIDEAERFKKGINEGIYKATEDNTDIIQELGYDGFYIMEGLVTGNKAKNIGVFNPNQLKSALGNKGTFSRKNDDILFKKAPKKKEPFSVDKEVDKIEDDVVPVKKVIADGFMGIFNPGGYQKTLIALRKKFQNSQAYLEDLEDKLRGSKQLIDGLKEGFNNVYEHITLSKGKADKIIKEMILPELQKLNEQKTTLEEEADKAGIKKIKGRLDLFLTALHDSERRSILFALGVPLNVKKNIMWNGKRTSANEVRNSLIGLLINTNTKLTEQQAQSIQKQLFSLTSNKKYQDALTGYAYRSDKAVAKENATPKQLRGLTDINNARYNPSKLSKDAVDTTLNTFNELKRTNPAVFKAMQDIQATIENINKMNVSINERANFIPPKAMNLINFYGFKNYVPLKKEKKEKYDVENYGLDEARMSGELVDTTSFFKGQQGQAANILDQVIEDSLTAASRVGRNNVTQAVKNLVLGKFYYDEIDETTGKSKRNRGKPILEGEIETLTYDQMHKDPDALKQALNAKGGKQKKITHYNPDGSIDIIRLKDREALEAIKNTYTDVPKMVEKLGRLTSRLGQLHTRFNIAFAPLNFLRDSITNAMIIRAEMGPEKAAEYADRMAKQVYKVGLRKTFIIANKFTNTKDINGINKYVEAQLKKGDTYPRDMWDFLSEGGMVSYRQALTNLQQDEDIRNQMMMGGIKKTQRAIAGFFDGYMSTFELSSRVAAYQTRLDDYLQTNAPGKSRAEVEQTDPETMEAARITATAFAKNLANFEQIGLSGRTLGSFFMFFRPSATGAVRGLKSVAPLFVRNFDAYAESLPDYIKNNPEALANYKQNFETRRQYAKDTVGVLIGFGMVMPILTAILAGEDEDGRNKSSNDDSSRWTRYARFSIGDDKVVQIPWGFGIGGFAAMGAQLSFLIDGLLDPTTENAPPKIIGNILNIGLDSFLPLPISRINPTENFMAWAIDTITPSAGRPMVEYALNLNAFGSRIYSQRAATRYGDAYSSPSNVPQAYQDLSIYLAESTTGFLNVEPSSLYFFASNYLDGIARLGANTYGGAQSLLGNKEFDAKRDLQFFESFLSKYSQVDQRAFARVVKESKDVIERVNLFKDTNPEKYLEYLMANPIALTIEERYNSLIGGDLKEVTSTIKQIKAMQELTPKEKSELLKILKEQQNALKRAAAFELDLYLKGEFYD